MSRTASIGISVGFLLLARIGEAQVSSAAGVGALLRRQGGGLWESLTRVEPAARFNSPYGRFGGEATFRTGNGTAFERGNLDLVVETPAWRGLRLSNSATIERFDARSRFVRERGVIESAVSYGLGGSGAWIGLASERPLGGRALSARGFDGDALLRAGAWRQLGPVTASLSSETHGLRTFFKTTDPRDSLTTLTFARLNTWSDLEARLSWSVGRVALDGRFGVQTDTGVGPSSLWGRATATVALAPRLSIVSAFGSQPARAWTGTPSARFASLGVRIAPAILARPTPSPHVQPVASRFALRPAESGTYVVTIRAPLARTVELSGDFNGWQPLSLHETRPDVWEATLALAPGTYHVNMRVNGASWIAPPGLSEAADEFNGTVGLLVVR